MLRVDIQQPNTVNIRRHYTSHSAKNTETKSTVGGPVAVITRSSLGRAHFPPTTVFRRLKTTRRCFDGRPIPVREIFPT